MLISQTAIAAEVETRVDFDTRDVNVSGSVEQASFNRMVSVTVSDAGRQYYINTVGTDPNGAYDFTFRMPEDSETGYYTITVGALGMNDMITQEFYFAKKTDIDSALASINDASDASSVLNAMEKNIFVLNLPEDWYNSLGTTGKMAIAEALYSNKPYQSINDATSVAYDELAVQAFRYAADASAIEKALIEFAEVYNINSDTAACYELYADSNIAGNAREIMVRYDSETVDEVITAYNESVLLAAINKAKDPLGIQSLISKYRDVIPFSLSTYDGADADKMATSLYKTGNFKSMADLEKAIETASEKPSGGGTGGSSGGGGGGGSTGGSTSSPGMIGFAPAATNAPVSTQSPSETTETSDDAVSFDDLADAEWAREAIEYLADKKIVNGMGGNTFDPNGFVTREQFVLMIVNALELYVDGAVSSFEDMPEGHWAYDAVSSACAKDIIFGHTDTEFGTGENITRQDMAVIAYRASKSAGRSFDSAEISGFTDEEDISDYARESVASMSNSGIINGYPDGRFGPADTATRAQAAQIIYSIIK